MPRPKGSKNKVPMLTIEQRIEKVSAEIESLQEQVKAKKNELKNLNTEKAEAEKRKLLEAIAASGKSVEEIISLINGGNEQ